MTRQEQLHFCKSCLNRNFDPRRGIICIITNEKASFSVVCPDYQRDENVKIEQKSEGNYQEKIKKIKKAKQAKPKIKEKLRIDDIYLILGLSLINTFLVRLAFYYTLSSDYGVYYTAILFSTIILFLIALIIRNKSHRGNKFFTDFKFNLVYILFLSLLLTLYSILMEEFYALGERFFQIIFISLIATLISSLFIKPFRYIIRRRHDKIV